MAQERFTVGETRVQGWESVLIFRSLTRERAALTTSPTFTSAKTTVGEQQPGSEPGISLGNPNPDWIGSVLNQLRLGNFFTTFLADVRSGGDVVIFSGSSLTIVDTSHIMMRDLSIGYSLPHGNIFTNATVSLSGRNLWVMHVEDGRFREHLFGYYRSIALSVTLGF